MTEELKCRIRSKLDRARLPLPGGREERPDPESASHGYRTEQGRYPQCDRAREPNTPTRPPAKTGPNALRPEKNSRMDIAAVTRPRSSSGTSGMSLDDRSTNATGITKLTMAKTAVKPSKFGAAVAQGISSATVQPSSECRP